MALTEEMKMVPASQLATHPTVEQPREHRDAANTARTAANAARTAARATGSHSLSCDNGACGRACKLPHLRALVGCV